MNHTRKDIFNNLAWIIASKLLQSILGLVIGVLTARYLGTSDYGLINYAATLVAIVLPIAQVGQSAVIVQEIVSSEDNEETILGSSIFLSFVSSVICYIGIVIFVFIFNRNEIETLICCAIYSISLFFQAMQLIRYWYQAKLLSKYISVLSLVAYVVTSMYKVILLIIKANTFLFALSYSIDFALIAIGGIYFFTRLSGKKLKISKDVCFRLLNKGKYFIIPGIMVTIMGQTDKLMLKVMIDNSATGIYSAAMACAGLTSFVFIAIIDTMRPVILANKLKSEKAFEKGMLNLFSIIFYLSSIISIVTGIFSKTIIEILYGADFSEAADVLVIVVWHTLLSFVGSGRDMWILANNKQAILGKINIIGALLNVVLNFFFINQYGVIGAAWASLISRIFVYIILGSLLKPISGCTKIMLKALDPRNAFDLIKDLKNRGIGING